MAAAIKVDILSKMKASPLVRWIVIVCVASVATNPIYAAEPFVRLHDHADGRQLQTASVTLTHASGVRVIVIGTIHFAEATYFAGIADELLECDAVVHEGFAQRRDRGSALPSKSVAHSLVRQADMLRCVGENYVRGDADVDRLTALSLASPHQVPQTRADLAAEAMRVEQDTATRITAERAYEIVARNRIAIATVQHRLTRGDRRIALLYGAAHTRDLVERLQQLGFAVESKRWRTAFKFADQ